MAACTAHLRMRRSNPAYVRAFTKPETTLIQRFAISICAAALSLTTASAWSQKKYGPGVTDTAVRIGQSIPYSGPLSSYGTLGKAQLAYFRMLNDQGGINGRKVELISLDDAYSPPKTVEMTRRLVEQDEVLAIYGTIGTPTNTAIHRYLNAKKVPQLLASSGGTKWNDPKNFPWTMAWLPTYHAEGRIYAEHIIKTKPDAKIGVLYQNDDFGKDYLNGLKEGLGARAAQVIVAEASYETSDPTVDSQVVALKAAGANVFVNLASPKAAALAIRKAADIGWQPVQYLVSISSSVSQVLKPSGASAASGIMTVLWLKDTSDTQWAQDEGMKWYLDFMKRYYPEGDPNDLMVGVAVSSAHVMAQILRQSGDDLTRENLMRQAASLKDVSPPLLLPGIRVNTSPTNYAMIESMQLARYDGARWTRFGEIMGRR
ncbi:ABC transporter substrate-binding protein [Variovorax sp. LjRoot84]